jgi:hypothetical protein
MSRRKSADKAAKVIPARYSPTAWFTDPHWRNENEPLAEWVDPSDPVQVENFRLLAAWNRWQRARSDYFHSALRKHV